MKLTGSILSYLLLCAQIVMAQPHQTHMVPLIENECFPLNSRGAGFFDRSHVTVLEVDLPPQTVEWHYRFVAYPNEAQARKMTKNFRLLADLKQQSVDSMKTLQVPERLLAQSESRVNVYLLSDSNAALDFANFLTWRNLDFHPKLSKMNVSSAWVKITQPSCLTGKQYIGISNSAALQGTCLFLEAVAVVKEDKPLVNSWTASELEKKHTEIVNFCALMDEKVLHPAQFIFLADCFTSTLSTNVNAHRFRAMNEIEQQQMEAWVFDKCLRSAQNEPDTLASDVTAPLLCGKWESEKGEAFYFDYNGSLQLTKASGQVILGEWQLNRGMLTLQFKGYRTQKYQSASISRNLIVWENYQTGKVLRIKRSPQ